MKARSYCLIANIFEPPLMLLDESKEYAIGRDAGAGIFLPARQVSRRHAKLSWSAEDGGFVIRDTWSRRGLQVNGKPTERRVLRDDDEIVIDPYRLRFRVYEGDLGILLRHGEGELPRDWRLAGRAQGAELLDLMALVDLADAAVALKVENDSQSGTLHIAGGQVLSAEASYLRGSRAAHALLMGERATFELRATPPAAPGDGAVRITQLLSEILARMGSDFVTTLDTPGIQEGDVVQLEKRLRAAEAERQLRALARQGRMLGEDVARAEEFQRSLQRPLPRDARVAFERLARPAGAVVGGVLAVTQPGPGLFRVFLGEPLASTGIEASLRSILLKAEYDLLDQPGVRGADIINLLHRRLAARPEQLRFTASCLEVAVDRAGTNSAIYATDGPPALVHVHHGAAFAPEPDPAAISELEGGLKISTLQLAPVAGDRLLLFSSAVPRQRGPGGREIGVARLAAGATRTARLELRAALDATVADLDAFREGAAQQGDFIVVGAELH